MTNRVRNEHDLTPKQNQTLALLARGYGSREVADRLGVSQKTVDTFRQLGFKTLGITNNAELVRWAIAHGVIELPTKDTWKAPR